MNREKCRACCRWRKKDRKRTNGTVCTKCIPPYRRGRSRVTQLLPQEYPTNSIEVACVSSTNRVSLYLNACGNKRHVRIGTVRSLARVKFPFSLLSHPHRVLSALFIALFRHHPRSEFTWHVGVMSLRRITNAF